MESSSARRAGYVGSVGAVMIGAPGNAATRPRLSRVARPICVKVPRRESPVRMPT